MQKCFNQRYYNFFPSAFFYSVYKPPGYIPFRLQALLLEPEIRKMYKPKAVYGISFSSVTLLRHLSFSFVFVRFPQRDYVMMKGIFLICIFFCSYFSSLEIRISRILDNFLSSSFFM